MWNVRVWSFLSVFYLFSSTKRGILWKTVYPKNISWKNNDLLNSINKFLLLNFYNIDNNKKILNLCLIFAIVVLTQDFAWTKNKNENIGLWRSNW